MHWALAEESQDKLIPQETFGAVQIFLSVQAVQEGAGRRMNLQICLAGSLQLLAVVRSDRPHTEGHGRYPSEGNNLTPAEALETKITILC